MKRVILKMLGHPSARRSIRVVDPIQQARCDWRRAVSAVRVQPTSAGNALTCVVGALVRLDVWHSLHTFIAQRSGDVQEHAVLLCSLLLGFGLDAYVCVGTVWQCVWRSYTRVSLMFAT